MAFDLSFIKGQRVIRAEILNPKFQHNANNIAENFRMKEVKLQMTSHQLSKHRTRQHDISIPIHSQTVATLDRCEHPST